MSKQIFKNILLLLQLLALPIIDGSEFISPSSLQLSIVPLDQIKYHLRGKGTGLEYRDVFDKAIAEEKIGFLGYHGSNIDFLIYQDIIRAVVEEILDIPIRKDFHFISTPLSENKHCQTLEELSLLFVEENYRRQEVMQKTFPLNFTMYGNHNCSGLNSIVNFSKNLSNTAAQNRKELIQFFDYLGLDPQLLELLYTIAYQYIGSKTGLLLQLFDTSLTPYAFANTLSYASYPNGFISENRLIHEFFLDNALGEFPHEMRIILNLQGILNPNSPFLIKRYTKVQPSKLKAWEQELRALVKNSSFDAVKKEELKQQLIQNWND